MTLGFKEEKTGENKGDEKKKIIWKGRMKAAQGTEGGKQENSKSKRV